MRQTQLDSVNRKVRKRRIFLLVAHPGESRITQVQRTLRLDGGNWSSCPRPWENASEVWVDAPCFPGVRANADRQTDASSLSEAIRF